MADQIIGRVFVKVTPDTSNFREEAKAKLEREEKRLPELKAEIDVDVDASGVEAQVRAARNAAQAVLSDLTLNIDVDEDFHSAIDRINAQLRGITAVDIPMRVDPDTFESVRRELARLSGTAIDIRVDLDDEGSIERAISNINRRLSEVRAVDLEVHLSEEGLAEAKARLEARLREINVPVEPEVRASAVVTTEGILAALTRAREVAIRPVVDRAGLAAINFVEVISGFRALRENIDDARRAFLGLFTNLPQIGAMTVGVLGLAGALLSASANAIGLLGSLVQLTPLLAALPGIIIGFGVTAVALADFEKRLPAVVEKFAALRKVISDGFWEIARGPIAELANAALPVLERALGNTSRQIGHFFASFAQALGASGGLLDHLPEMFRNLDSSIGRFAEHTPAIAGIITSFGRLGSAILPPLADLIGSIADEFDRWLATALAAGGIENVVNSTIGALSGLFEVIKGASGVFVGFWTAASRAGAATLGSLGQALQDFAARLADPQIQATLTRLFQSAFTMMDNFLSMAGPAFEQVFVGLTTVLATVLPQVGTLLGQISEVLGGLFSDPAVQQGLTAFVQGITKGATAILPALEPIGGLIASLGPTLGMLATQIGQIFGALAPTFDGLLVSIQPLITILGGALVGVLQAVSPLITSLGSVLAEVFTQLAPMLAPVIDQLVQLISAVLPQLMPIVQQLAPLLLQIVSAVLPIIVALLPVIAELLSGLIQAATPILGLITELIALIVPVLVPALTFLAEILAGAVAGAVDGVIRVIRGVLEILTGVINFVVGVFTGDWQRAWDGIKSIFQGVWDLIVGIVEYALNVGILGIFKKGLSVLKSTWDDAWKRIKDFFDESMGKIQNGVNDGLNAIANFFKGLWGKISGAISSLWNSVTSLFTSGMNTAKSRVSTGISDVVKFFTQLPGKILKGLGNLGNLLLNVGKDLIRGLAQGIRNMAGEVVSAIKSSVLDKIPSQIKKFFGIHSPSRMFMEFGQFLMQGLAIGIEDESDRVVKALDSVMRKVEDYDFKPPAVDLGVNASLYTGEGAAPAGSTFIYNAAPGSSISSEEDLFAAMGRARAFGFGG